jgi:hypothetical protein
MAYTWDYDGTPYVNQLVTYVLSQEECVRFKKDSFSSVYPATITFIHTTTCVDLNATVNVPSVIAKSAAITNFSITSNVVTFNAANNFSPGSDIVLISGLSVGTYLNGLQLTVLSSNGTQFTVFFANPNVSSTSDSGTAKQVQATLMPQSVTFGNSQRNWYPGEVFSGVLPAGSPF